MRILVASLLVALTASTAAADKKKTPTPAPTPTLQPADATMMSTTDCAKARAANKTCVINIEGIDVEGNPMGPDGIRVDLIGFSGLGSLITLRRDFIKEILRSAEDL
jgi:hypothetical protein